MTESMHLNYQNAVDEYDEEIVNLSISLFITETYSELKTKMPEAYKNKNYQEIKAIAHKFKTTSKYMGADDFAAICGKIQKCVDKGKESLKQIDELYQTFMTKLDVLYNVCIKFNGIIQNTVNENEANEEANKEAKEKEKGDNNNIEVKKKEKDHNKGKEKSVEFIFNLDNKEKQNKSILHKSKSAYSTSTYNSELKQEKNNQIQIRYAKAIQTFDAEIIDVIIEKFVTDEYKVIKTNLLNAFKKRDTKAILTQLHTMKLKAKYMCAEEFAANILKLETCIKESKEDLKQLEALFPEFLENMELLYKEVQNCYEKNNEKEMNDSMSFMTTTPSFSKDILYINNNYFNSIENNNDNSHLTSKKLITSSKFGLMSKNAKLREFDQFSNRNIMSSNKKGMFDIDLSFLKTNDNDANNTFDNDINPLFTKFKDAIDDCQHDSLIECLIKLKELISRYKFNILPPYIDEWLQMIETNKDFKLLNAYYDGICILLNQMKYLMNEKKDFNCARTTGNYSLNKIINDSPSCSTVARNEDNILLEFKPLSINFFYSSSYLPEDLETHINQIIAHHAEEKKDKGGFMKHLVKPCKTNITSADSNYPFKEETIQCRIV